MSRNITAQADAAALDGVRNGRISHQHLTTRTTEDLPKTAIAGIGTSAQSLPAVAELAARLPAVFKPAILVAGEYPVNLLVDLLCQATRLPVVPASDGLAIKPGFIYLNPENSVVTLSGGVFHVAPSEASVSHRIDASFRSLAEDIGERAIGVLLGGTGWDGAAGLHAIRAVGGVTLTQFQPASPQDFGVLSHADGNLASPEELAATLERLASQKPAVSDEDLDEVYRALRRAESYDLRHLDPLRIRRVVLRHMALHGIDSAKEFLSLLREGGQEAASLFRDLVTHSHRFFEETATWQALQAACGETLWKSREVDEPFRVWVPGCSTGEESYSVAIAVLEMLELLGGRPTIQVFGTDLLETSLQFARAGQYPIWIEQDVTAARLSRFFRQHGSSYIVRAELRTACLFARQDLVSDPPLSRMDLIVFRNQLDSVAPSMQSRLLSLFHYSLTSGGALVLGNSGRMEVNPQAFEPFFDVEGVYVRRGQPVRPWFGVPVRHAEEALPVETDAFLVAPETQEPAPVTSLRPARSWEQMAKKAGRHVRELLEEQAETIEALKLANEEITCSNEELQATNEELMAAREEVQAANGELEMVNREMQRRNQELSSLSSELSALLRNIHLAVVTVDANLSVRYFTPEGGAMFRLEPADLGRPVTDLSPRLRIGDLEPMLQDSVANLAIHDLEVSDDQGRRYQLVVRPYRTEENRIDGAIITAWPRP